MAGKRLLDMMAILSASREVAKKSVELRSRQLELYVKTSSLAQAFRSQSNKVKDNIKADPFSTSSQDESSTTKVPGSTSRFSPEISSSPESILSPKISNFSLVSSTHSNENILNQRKSDQNSLMKNFLKEKSERPVVGKQEKLGTNSRFNDINFDGSLKKSQNEHRNNLNENLLFEKDNQVKYALKNNFEEQEPPENVNTGIFQSPKVARLLGGKVQGKKLETKDPNTMKNMVNFPLKTAQISQNNSRQNSNFPDTQTGVQNELTLKSSQEFEVDMPSAKFSEISKTENDSNLESSKLKESKVPASRIARLWNYGGLAAGMLGGVVSERFRRVRGGEGDEVSFITSGNNMNKLVTKLSRMRGAALKLGQMMSFQDSKMLPTPVQEVLQRLQDSADYMPSYQRDRVLIDNLGSEWRNLFSSFEEIPLAAASIGQVHRAVLKSNGVQVAVKVQYPGVAESIDSDLKNLEILLTASRLLPKGLFLDKTIANARTELSWECDYLREAECIQRFKRLLHDETNVFIVPSLFPEASGKQVLTMEFMNGIAISKIKNLTQKQKDWIGTQVLRLCLREIFQFRFMQTDPNWTNFFYNKSTGKLELLDFGASREYSQEFINKYAQLLVAASHSDKESLKKISIDLGYLTSFEPKTMIEAHINSILTLAEPFLDISPQTYDFRNQTITDRVRGLIPVMIRERLSPPPEETYSLHRKLSGAFLLCARLGSRVPCRKLFEETFGEAKLI